MERVKIDEDMQKNTQIFGIYGPLVAALYEILES